MRTSQNYRGQNYRGGYRKNYRNDSCERGRSRSRDSFWIIPEGMTEGVAVDLYQVQKLELIEIGL